MNLLYSCLNVTFLSSLLKITQYTIINTHHISIVHSSYFQKCSQVLFIPPSTILKSEMAWTCFIYIPVCVSTEGVSMNMFLSIYKYVWAVSVACEWISSSLFFILFIKTKQITWLKSIICLQSFNLLKVKSTTCIIIFKQNNRTKGGNTYITKGGNTYIVSVDHFHIHVPNILYMFIYHLNLGKIFDVLGLRTWKYKLTMLRKKFLIYSFVVNIVFHGQTFLHVYCKYIW